MWHLISTIVIFFTSLWILVWEFNKTSSSTFPSFLLPFCKTNILWYVSFPSGDCLILLPVPLKSSPSLPPSLWYPQLLQEECEHPSCFYKFRDCFLIPLMAIVLLKLDILEFLSPDRLGCWKQCHIQLYSPSSAKCNVECMLFWHICQVCTYGIYLM